MGFLDRFRNQTSATYNYDGTVITDHKGSQISPRSVTLEGLLSSKSIDLVDVNGDSIIVVEAPSHSLHPVNMHADPDTIDLQMGIELGRTTTAYSKYLREEYNPELRDQQGLIKYDRMRRSDAATRAALKTLKTPVLGATWYLQPFDEKPRSKDIANFVQRNFTQYMSYPFSQVIQEALLMVDYGFYCVDSETEILTRRGWKHHNELIDGEYVLTLNADTGLAEWNPLKSINRFEGDFDMLSIDTRGHSSCTTLDHNWITRAYDTKKLRFKKTDKLNTNDCIVTSAPCSELPAESKYSDSLVELVAWFYTEGQVYPNGAVSIWQNAGLKCDKIRSCLYDLFGPPGITRHEKKTAGVPQWREGQHRGLSNFFYLNLDASRILTDLIPDKIVGSEFVLSLTKSQLHLFIETSISADGHFDWLFQKNPFMLDAAEMAAALLGIPTVRKPVGKDGFRLHFGKQTDIRPLASVKRSPWSSKAVKAKANFVWCPTVENKTWLARRNGTIYFTGNCFEKVWDVRTVGRAERVYLKKLAPRHPMDVYEWHLDENGGPSSLDFYNAPGTTDHANIKIDKLAIFSYDAEGGDMRGISVLRSAYKNWYFSENFFKIDAIQKERHGIGIPVIKLPPGFTIDDRNKAQELGENLRTNEKAHVVLPPYWEVMFARLEGQPVSPIESAEYHQKMIYQNVLAQAIYANVSGSDTDVMTLFYKSTRHLADLIRAVFNKYIIPQIVGPNWDIEDYPELKVRRLGDTKEARTISFALRNAIGANLVRVDDDLEDWFRDLMDAPKHNPSTYRPPPPKNGASPAGGTAEPTQARVGLPRQAPATTMQQGKSPGRSNSGFDQSGG